MPAAGRLKGTDGPPVAAAGEEHPAGGREDDPSCTLLRAGGQQCPGADRGGAGHRGGSAGEEQTGLPGRGGWGGWGRRACTGCVFCWGRAVHILRPCVLASGMPWFCLQDVPWPYFLCWVPPSNGERACGWVLGGRQSPQDRPAQGAAETRGDRPTRGQATTGAAFWAREPVLTTLPSRVPGSASSPACRRWTSPRTSSSQGPHPWMSSGEAGGGGGAPGVSGSEVTPKLRSRHCVGQRSRKDAGVQA